MYKIHTLCVGAQRVLFCLRIDAFSKKKFMQINIIMSNLEENTISDRNMEGDLLFILHKMIIGKNLQIQKRRKNVNYWKKLHFFCAI